MIILCTFEDKQRGQCIWSQGQYIWVFSTCAVPHIMGYHAHQRPMLIYWHFCTSWLISKAAMERSPSYINPHQLAQPCPTWHGTQSPAHHHAWPCSALTNPAGCFSHACCSQRPDSPFLACWCLNLADCLACGPRVGCWCGPRIYVHGEAVQARQQFFLQIFASLVWVPYSLEGLSYSIALVCLPVSTTALLMLKWQGHSQIPRQFWFQLLLFIHLISSVKSENIQINFTIFNQDVTQQTLVKSVAPNENTLKFTY